MWSSLIIHLFVLAAEENWMGEQAETSYPLIFTSFGNVGPYSHSGTADCPSFACDTVMVHTFQDLDVQD